MNSVVFNHVKEFWVNDFIKENVSSNDILNDLNSSSQESCVFHIAVGIKDFLQKIEPKFKNLKISGFKDAGEAVSQLSYMSKIVVEVVDDTALKELMLSFQEHLKNNDKDKNVGVSHAVVTYGNKILSDNDLRDKKINNLRDKFATLIGYDAAFNKVYMVCGKSISSFVEQRLISCDSILSDLNSKSQKSSVVNLIQTMAYFLQKLDGEFKDIKLSGFKDSREAINQLIFMSKILKEVDSDFESDYVNLEKRLNEILDQRINTKISVSKSPKDELPKSFKHPRVLLFVGKGGYGRGYEGALKEFQALNPNVDCVIVSSKYPELFKKYNVSEYTWGSHYIFEDATEQKGITKKKPDSLELSPQGNIELLRQSHTPLVETIQRKPIESALTFFKRLPEESGFECSLNFSDQLKNECYGWLNGMPEE